MAESDQFDFGHRTGTGCLKWDHTEKYCGLAGILPLWLADLDIPLPECVVAAIRERAAHAFLSYTGLPRSYEAAFAQWCSERYGLEAAEGTLLVTTGTLTSIALAVRAFAPLRDGVIICTPCYGAVAEVVVLNGRTPLECPLLPGEPHYSLDTCALASLAPKARLLILCNPQNPTGAVLSNQEAEAISAIAEEAGLVVVSDEVLADFVHCGAKHQPYASTGPAARLHSVTLMSPSKSFNAGGLKTSNALFFSRALATAFEREMDRMGCWLVNPLSIAAAEAMYLNCASWAEEARRRVGECLRLAQDGLRRFRPEIRTYMPEAGMSLWLDCSSLAPRVGSPHSYLAGQALIGTRPGGEFGHAWREFVRASFGGRAEVANEFLLRLKRCLRSHHRENLQRGGA